MFKLPSLGNDERRKKVPLSNKFDKFKSQKQSTKKQSMSIQAHNQQFISTAMRNPATFLKNVNGVEQSIQLKGVRSQVPRRDLNRSNLKN